MSYSAWPGGAGPEQAGRLTVGPAVLEGTATVPLARRPPRPGRRNLAPLGPLRRSGFYFMFTREVTEYNWGCCFAYRLCNARPSPCPKATHKAVFVLCEFKVSFSSGKRIGDHKEETEFSWLSDQKYGTHQGSGRSQGRCGLQATEASVNGFPV